MSKMITSPVKDFPGTVILRDPLNIEQVLIVEQALDSQEEAAPSRFLKRILEREGKSNEEGSADVLTWKSSEDRYYIPAICACTESWHLEGLPERVTPDNFPATPRVSSHVLVMWIFGEIFKIYVGDTEIPNE